MSKFESLNIVLEGLSEADQQKVSQHNQRVAKLIESIRSAEDMANSLVDKTDCAFADLEAQAVKLRSRIHNLHQQAVSLAEERGTLLAGFEKGFHKLCDDAQQNLQKVTAKTGTALKKAGFAPEDQPLFPNNPEAEQVKFDQMVKKSAEVREAQTNWEQCQHLTSVWIRKRQDAGKVVAEMKLELASITRRFVRV